jgi:hypothetical protein
VITVQQDKISSLEQWQQQKLHTLLGGRGGGFTSPGVDIGGRGRGQYDGENRRNYEEPPPPPPPASHLEQASGKPPRSPASPGSQVALQELSSPNRTSDAVDTIGSAEHNDKQQCDDDAENAHSKASSAGLLPRHLSSSLPLSPNKGPRSPGERPVIRNIYENRAPPLGVLRASVPRGSGSGAGRYSHAADPDTDPDPEADVEGEHDASGGTDEDFDVEESTVFGMLDDGEHEHSVDDYGDAGAGAGSAGSSPSASVSVGSHPWSLQEDEVSVDGSTASTGSGSFSMIQQYYYDNHLDEVEADGTNSVGSQ